MKVAVVGLGYVGLPLAVEFGKKFPTIGFDLLYALVIVRLARRDLVWINVTTPSDRGLDRTPDHRSIPLG